MKFEDFESVGVCDWEGYDLAVLQAEMEGHDWYELSDDDKLYYLEMEGLHAWYKNK